MNEIEKQKTNRITIAQYLFLDFFWFYYGAIHTVRAARVCQALSLP